MEQRCSAKDICEDSYNTMTRRKQGSVNDSQGCPCVLGCGPRSESKGETRVVHLSGNTKALEMMLRA